MHSVCGLPTSYLTDRNASHILGSSGVERRRLLLTPKALTVQHRIGGDSILNEQLFYQLVLYFKTKP